MSDPAKTPEEIEDVLASVRRLVSDHGPAADSAPEPITPTPQPVDALVLTPSFRVTDPEDPWVPVPTSQDMAAVEEDAAEQDAMDRDLIAEKAADAEGLIAELMTAQAEVPVADAEDDVATDPDWQPDDRLASFDAVGEAPEPTPEEWLDDHSNTASDAEIADLIRLDGPDVKASDFESETGDDNWPGGGAEAALLTLVARRDPVFEPEEAAEDVSVDEVAAEADPTPEATEDVAPTVELHEEVTTEAASMDAPIEDVAPVEDATPVEDTDPIDDTTPEDPTETDPTVEDLGDTPSPFTFPEPDEGILDEETLREIIVDVVREELQGVLGQRITRNVRKMVRREIRLALAAEDLE